jgi:DNA-3-methyladenine glycosylase I
VSEGRTPSGVVAGDDGIVRCWWCVGDPLLQRYHDLEWGRPLGDDPKIFEKLCLEGFQSGLSWLTILRKRDNFRKAFKSFDIPTVAHFNTRSVERLMLDAGIVRNRAKIEATIGNARRCMTLVEELGSLATYVWSFEPDGNARPKRLDRATLMEVTTSEAATAMSRDLKKRGWSFVGPTNVYSAMQSIGLVNDHLSDCVFRDEVERARTSFRRRLAGG